MLSDNQDFYQHVARLLGYPLPESIRTKAQSSAREQRHPIQTQLAVCA